MTLSRLVRALYDAIHDLMVGWAQRVQKIPLFGNLAGHKWYTHPLSDAIHDLMVGWAQRVPEILLFGDLAEHKVV